MKAIARSGESANILKIEMTQVYIHEAFAILVHRIAILKWKGMIGLD
jgi:hypothetical protein